MRRFGIMVVLLSIAQLSCGVGATEKEAICSRATRIEQSVTQVSSLVTSALSMGGEALRNQLQDDVNSFLVALDVAPKSLTADLSNIVQKLQNLYIAFESVSWDTARASNDDNVARTLEVISSANSLRHLVRISDYITKNCTTESVDATPPPDSSLSSIATSTSLLTPVADRVNPDPPRKSEDIALGYTLADSLGITIDEVVAECLGRAVQSVTNADLAPTEDEYVRAFNPAFEKCGIDISTTTLG